jgi:hypothetical protein
MTISMHGVLVPVSKRALTALSAILDKAAAFAEAKKIDPSVLIGDRLAPDMLPFSKQIQIATDGVKGGAARLAGIEIPSYEDNETTFEELKARIAKTLAFVEGFSASQIDGTEDKTIVLKMRAGDISFTGQQFLLHFVLPNLFFHCTTAYDILRHNGVEIGKSDYLGKP